MSSFLKIQTHAFCEDDEDEDYKICDFAMKRVQIDINANDSNIALHTRSKIQLPDDGNNKTKKIYETDCEYQAFLQNFWNPPTKNERDQDEMDEDFEIDENENSQSPSKLNSDFDHHIDRNFERDLLDLNRFQNSSNSSYSNIQNNNNNNNNNNNDNIDNNKKVTVHIGIPFHIEQRKSIQNELKQLFQLLIIVRHSSLNNIKYRNAHILSTQLLYQFNYCRLGSIQSIRFAIAKQSGILNQLNTKTMTQQEANQIAIISTQHLYIDSMMDIPGIAEYFQYNQNNCRSYGAVITRFRGILLDEQYIPTTIPDLNFDAKSIEKDKKFTETEEKLLGLGIKEYGQKLQQPMISNNNVGISRNVMINDWTSIRDRFLPHKSIKSLQNQIGKIRKLNHELRYEYKLRPPTKDMNDIELSLLAQGTKTYGLKKWAKISKQLLPNWTPNDIKKKYYKKLLPRIQSMKQNIAYNTKQIKFFNPSIDAVIHTKNYHNKHNKHHIHNNNNIHNLYQNHNNHNNHNNRNIDMLQSLFCESSEMKTLQKQKNNLNEDEMIDTFEAMDADIMGDLKSMLEQELNN